MTAILSRFARVGAVVLIVLGLGIVGVEVALHIRSVLNDGHYTVSWIMLVTAFVLGFVGMYILNPRGAKDGGQFIVDNTIRVVQVFRQGKRVGDPLTAVVEDREGRRTAMTVVPPNCEETSLTPSRPEYRKRKTDAPPTDNRGPR